MQVLTLALVLLFQPSPKDKAVVFVCEHGAAKSVVATAYFNKLAAERGLPFRATFRGTTLATNRPVADSQISSSVSYLLRLTESGCRL